MLTTASIARAYGFGVFESMQCRESGLLGCPLDLVKSIATVTSICILNVYKYSCEYGNF